MRILIAGGVGFLGGRIAQHLSIAGHQIILGSRKEVDLPKWLPNAEVVKFFWDDVSQIQKICTSVDVIINAAGMNAQDCAGDPVAAMKFNGEATGRLIEAAARANVKRFIQISTAHVYSHPLVGRISEDTLPKNLHPYATSHLAGEKYLEHASKNWGLEGIVIRLSNAYGIPVHEAVNCWGLFVNDLCRQVVEKKAISLNSDGRQRRDFIPIKDLLYVLGELLLSRKSEASIFETYNVGFGESKSLNEMAELIQGRCSHLFGYVPKLYKFKEDGSTESDLLYDCRKINGIIPSEKNNENDEIDQLLKYCQYHFS